MDYAPETAIREFDVGVDERKCPEFQITEQLSEGASHLRFVPFQMH